MSTDMAMVMVQQRWWWLQKGLTAVVCIIDSHTVIG